MPENPQEDLPKSKRMHCGLRVSTWGSHHGAGNGMLHYLNSQWFGGNVGHAAVTLTIPADEKGEALIKQYCTDPRIPFQKKTHTVKEAVLDPITGKYKQGDKVVHQEEVYEIHFSWWPPITEGNQYDLAESLSVDSLEEWQGVNFDWAPDLLPHINPQIRRYKKDLGETIMSFGPLVVVHGRELSPEKQKELQCSVAYIGISKESESLDVLIKKLEPDNDKKLWIGFTEKNLLNRFIPDWTEKVQDKKEITNDERKQLLKIARQKKADFTATTNRMSEVNDLLSFKERVLDPLGPLPVNQNLFKDLIFNFSKSKAETDINKDIARILFPVYFNILKKIKEQKEITEQELLQLQNKWTAKVKELKEKVTKVLPNVIFPEHSFNMELPFDEHHATAGKPPDNVVKFPLLKNSFDYPNFGHEAGLDPENMLKQMQALVRADAEGFNLKTNNCSKTVGAILEAGSHEPHLKKIFQNKAFGFFGNPQEVYNNAEAVHTAIYGGEGKSQGILTRLGSFNPIEQAGGYLIGIWMETKGPMSFPNFLKKSGVILGGLIVGPLALISFTLEKLTNPLKSFQGARDLFNYTLSRNFKGGAHVLKWLALFTTGLSMVIFAIPAVLQKGIQRGIQELKNLGKSQEGSAIQARVLERENLKNLPLEEQRKIIKSKEKQQKVDGLVSRYIQRRIIDIESSDPIAGLRRFKEVLESSTNIPRLSINTQKMIQDFIKSTPMQALPQELQEFNVLGSNLKEIYSTLNENAFNRLKELEKFARAKMVKKVDRDELMAEHRRRQQLEMMERRENLVWGRIHHGKRYQEDKSLREGPREEFTNKDHETIDEDVTDDIRHTPKSKKTPRLKPPEPDG